MPSQAAVEIAGAVAYEGKFQWLTRLGFAARGLLYILIAILAVRTGRTEDLTGALEFVGHGSGKILLTALAAGLVAYGLWRLSDAVLGTEHPGGGWKQLGRRAIYGGIGIIYLYLGYKAVRVIVAGRAGAMNAEQQADTVLDLPGGELVLLAVAIVLAIAGAAQLWKAVACTFMRRLQEGASGKQWVRWMGRLGYAARGIVFLVVAGSIYRAAVDHRASEAGNLEKALDLLRGPFLLPIAGGLFLFGAFSLVEARYRAIHKPPTDGLKRKVEEKLRD